MTHDPDSQVFYVTIRVTSDVLIRLRELQSEFTEKTNGGTITQSSIIKKGLELIESTGTLAVQSGI